MGFSLKVRRITVNDQLAAHASRILAGTGLTPEMAAILAADPDATAPAPAAAAAAAVRDGWAAAAAAAADGTAGR